MKTTTIASILCLTVLAVNVAHADGLVPGYAKVESVIGCGATGQPLWTSTTTEYTIADGVFWLGLEKEDVDSVRIGVTCVGCSLYDNTIDNWFFWDVASAVWDPSIDLGGYYTSSGSNYYYRGEEKNELCSQNYGWGITPIMKIKWGYTYPGDQEQWVFRYPVTPI